MEDQRKPPNFECPNHGCEFGCGTIDELNTHRRKCLIGFDKNYKPSEISWPRGLGEQIVRKACHRKNRYTGLRCGKPVTDPGGYKCPIGSMICRCPPTCDRIVPGTETPCGLRVNHEGTKCSLRDVKCKAFVENTTKTCIRKIPDTGTPCGELVRTGYNQCKLGDVKCKAYVENSIFCIRINPDTGTPCGYVVQKGHMCGMNDSNCRAYVRNFTNTCNRPINVAGEKCRLLVEAHGSHLCKKPSIHCRSWNFRQENK